jgi:hypothetical protein
MVNSQFNMPAGRLSYVKHSTGTIHIQTEFSSYPNIRIITTVVLNGAVLIKESNDWQEPIATDGDVRKAESALASQHERIYEKTLKVIKSLGSSGPSKISEKKQRVDPVMDLAKHAENIDGVEIVTVFDSDGAILYSTGENRDCLATISAPTIAAFTRLISERFNSGSFIKATFKAPENGLCWLLKEDKIIAAQGPKPEATIRQIQDMKGNDG